MRAQGGRCFAFKESSDQHASHSRWIRNKPVCPLNEAFGQNSENESDSEEVSQFSWFCETNVSSLSSVSILQVLNPHVTKQCLEKRKNTEVGGACSLCLLPVERAVC